MIRVTWLIAWVDHTWSTYVEDYAAHNLEDLSEVEQTVADLCSREAKKEVALVALYRTEDLEDSEE